MFDDLPRNHFCAILADPPWRFRTYSERGEKRSANRHYNVMSIEDIYALPVAELAASNSVLFLWGVWPHLKDVLTVIERWGFDFKTCAFDWMKADVSTLDMFQAPKDADMKMGYWTRSNSEFCLLATRGKPKRISADVRQGIIEPAREHSRKPDCIQSRIERLVKGPYLEIFARQRINGWTCVGKEIDRFPPRTA